MLDKLKSNELKPTAFGVPKLALPELYHGIDTQRSGMVDVELTKQHSCTRSSPGHVPCASHNNTPKTAHIKFHVYLVIIFNPKFL